MPLTQVVGEDARVASARAQRLSRVRKRHAFDESLDGRITGTGIVAYKINLFKK